MQPLFQSPLFPVFLALESISCWLWNFLLGICIVSRTLQINTPVRFSSDVERKQQKEYFTLIRCYFFLLRVQSVKGGYTLYREDGGGGWLMQMVDG